MDFLVQAYITGMLPFSYLNRNGNESFHERSALTFLPPSFHLPQVGHVRLLIRMRSGALFLRFEYRKLCATLLQAIYPCERLSTRMAVSRAATLPP
jgi:hypothetical protein